MDENSTGASDALCDRESAPVPRLSIAHLMLWIFCTAAYLGIYRMILLSRRDAREITTRVFEGQGLFNSVFVGALLAASVILWRSRGRRAGRIATQPGHWLLIVPGFLSVANLWVSIVTANLSFYPPTMYMAYCVLATCLYGYIALRTQGFGWRICFAVFAGIQFLPWLGFSILHWSAPATLGIVTSIAMLALSFVERNSGLSRDWFHWLGLFVTLCRWIVYLLTALAFRYVAQ